MSRITATFEKLKQQGKKALIPFVTAGDPDQAMTLPIMHALVAAGADVIELGVPFSDPMADGPTIQRSSERALVHGTSLKDVLGFVAEFRKTNQMTPIVLMGYANPIEAMGYEKFAEGAKASGVDGVLVVDYPPEESTVFVDHLYRHDIDPIYLLSPTTPEARIETISKLVRGYIYYVSLKGVTGAATLDLEDVARNISAIRKYIKIPIGVGFGIRDAETARAVAQFSDAVVIGSTLVLEIERSARDKIIANLSHLLNGIRTALDTIDSGKSR